MPKLRITNQHNKKSKRRTIGKVKKIGNKYTRKNHHRNIHQNGGYSNKKIEKALRNLPNNIRKEIIESTKINIKDKLTKTEIEEIKEDGNIAEIINELEIFLKKGNKDSNVTKLLSVMKFNKYRLNSKTGKRDKNVRDQAIDIIKNNKIKDIQDIMTSKLTNKNIDDLLKGVTNISCKDFEIRKALENMKFNPTLINIDTDMPYISLFQQADHIIKKKGNTDQDILDLIKNNSSEHIYSSTDVDLKLR
jgi:hypothetical protein